MIDLDELRKASTAVYLAAHADVAEDLSRIMRGAADEIGRLRASLGELLGLHEIALHNPATRVSEGQCDTCDIAERARSLLKTPN